MRRTTLTMVALVAVATGCVRTPPVTTPTTPADELAESATDPGHDDAPGVFGDAPRAGAPTVTTSAVGDRHLVWTYDQAMIDSGCPNGDPADPAADPLCQVSRFEVWPQALPPDPMGVWVDAGMAPSPRGLADEWGHLLPPGETYRAVRACNGIECGSSTQLAAPGQPTGLRLWTEP
jgi:hypothetical protein